MALGYLTIQARTAHDAIPLEGIRIRVTDTAGNSLYELTTDESGETGRIPLETLEQCFSQNPYFSGTPFLSYHVYAQKEGFDSLRILDIPIYDGETAILPLALTPMLPGQRSSSLSEIFIGKPAAAMQEANRQPGFMESLSEPYILRQVIIPNPITVHLGTPSSSATNVQVPFIDYVKNAASSEIYPTWPKAALTANIYAIITFALNRVYTEWYRSRGYRFDITNSTAYDQYFVYGRPIYDSISSIVDSIFNEYVKRQGQPNPYFTSFCNGTTVTCQGLSQWGTVSLADKGQTPIQILRAYYPKDIEIATTNSISSSISSYPGTALRMGSRGLNVETIQTYLNRIRKNYPAIPAITDETGVFQKTTKAAVTKFQQVFNLTADGIVGKTTWYKISYIYAAVARLAELDGEGAALGIGTIPPNSILRRGSVGQDVILLQYLLNVISEFYPGIPSVTQDGIFGSRTAQAVGAFQKAMRQNADEIVGPLTWDALYQAYRGIEASVPSQKPGTEIIEYTVQPGDTLWSIARKFHTTVAAIQKENDLTGSLIVPGQILKIVVTQTAQRSVPAPNNHCTDEMDLIQ